MAAPGASGSNGTNRLPPGQQTVRIIVDYLGNPIVVQASQVDAVATPVIHSPPALQRKTRCMYVSPDGTVCGGKIHVAFREVVCGCGGQFCMAHFNKGSHKCTYVSLPKPPPKANHHVFGHGGAGGSTCNN